MRVDGPGRRGVGGAHHTACAQAPQVIRAHPAPHARGVDRHASPPPFVCAPAVPLGGHRQGDLLALSPHRQILVQHRPRPAPAVRGGAAEGQVPDSPAFTGTAAGDCLAVATSVRMRSPSHAGLLLASGFEPQPSFCSQGIRQRQLADHALQLGDPGLLCIQVAIDL